MRSSLIAYFFRLDYCKNI